MLLFAGWIVVVTLILIEGGLRFLTTEEDGVSTLLGTRLLPIPALLPAQRAILERDRESFQYYVPDGALGWTLRPEGESPDGLYHANSMGLRTSPARPVPSEEAPTGQRILLVGDSYTHADEVGFADSWGAQLEALLGAPHEVWNGGVSGYGTDQALLRYRALHDRVRPNVVILGIYREDLQRNLTCFRAVKHPFTGFPFGKPRFTLEGPGLRLHHQPVTPADEVASTLDDYANSPLSKIDAMHFPELQSSDWRDFSRLWRLRRSRAVQSRVFDARERAVRNQGEGVLLTARLAKTFRDEVLARGAHPLVVILPGGPELAGYGAGGKPPMRHLMRALESEGVPYIDCGPALFQGLGERPLSALYARDGVGHPNAEGCALIARRILSALPPR